MFNINILNDTELSETMINCPENRGGNREKQSCKWNNIASYFLIATANEKRRESERIKTGVILGLPPFCTQYKPSRVGLGLADFAFQIDTIYRYQYLAFFHFDIDEAIARKSCYDVISKGRV